MYGGRGTLKACNFVHNDEIWKDHVRMELSAQRKFLDRWGYYACTYRKLEKSLEEVGDDIPPNSKLPNDTADLVDKAAEIYNFKSKEPKERYPETDSKLIGWRLEFAAPISQNIIKNAGKKNVINQLQWPAESL